MKYLITLLFLTTTSFAATFELKPGLWKLETEIEVIPDESSVQKTLPQKQEEQESLTEMCVTEEESKLENSLVKNGECRFENIKQNKDELSGDITCTKNRTGKARWKKISEDEFIMTMETRGDSRPVRLTQKGKFLRSQCAQS